MLPWCCPKKLEEDAESGCEWEAEEMEFEERPEKFWISKTTKFRTMWPEDAVEYSPKRRN
eukprot:UN01761